MGTGCYYQCIGALIGNVILNEFHTFLTAQVGMNPANGDAAFISSHLAELFCIKGISNATSRAYIDCGLFFH
jgi:hypothetical protein